MWSTCDVWPPSVAPCRPSSPLVIRYRSKSQSALIMLLETQMQGSKFLTSENRRNSLHVPMLRHGWGSVRANARLKDLVCATRGHAVYPPAPTRPRPNRLPLEETSMEKPRAGVQKRRKLQRRVSRCGASDLPSGQNVEKWPFCFLGSSVQYYRNGWFFPGTELGMILSRKRKNI